MKRLLPLLLAALLPSAQAQIGQKTSELLSQPLFKEAKASRTGIYTLKNGVNVILTQKGNYLTGANIVTTYTMPQGVANTADTAVATGVAEQRVGGTARAAEIAGIVTGFGDGLAGPLLQFLRQPNIAALLPQGVTVDAAPFTIRAKTQGRVLTLNVALAQAAAADLPKTTLARPAAKPSASEVTVRVFSDFQCPYCQQFERQTMPELLKALPDDVRVEFHHFPLEQIHPLARPTAEAAECAVQQGKGWAYKDALFADTSWAVSNPNETFLKLAGDLKLDTAKFKDCLALRGGKAAVDTALQSAAKLKLQGTPTVYVGGFRASNPYDVPSLLKLIELARAAR